MTAPTRRLQPRAAAALVAVALITLSAVCVKPAISISDQQQQVASESTQKQTPLAPPPSAQSSSATRSGIQTTSGAKSSTSAEHTGTEQPATGTGRSKTQQTSANKHAASPAAGGGGGKVRKLARQPASAPTSPPTNGAAPDQRHDEASKSIYHNTPPLFVTPTRDFYVDVARHSPGAKLTTIQAIDMEGDQIEYSLRAAKFLDGSPYFAINVSTGELRLTSKRIFELPRVPDRALDDDDDDELDDTSAQVKEQLQEERQLEPQAHDSAGHLYFLNVAAWDGQYTTVIELKIHVLGPAPVRLSPESSHRDAESLMRLKTSEFLMNLYSADQQRRPIAGNSTLVLPNFVNPPLLGVTATDSGGKRPDSDNLQLVQENKPLPADDAAMDGNDQSLDHSSQAGNTKAVYVQSPDSPHQATSSLITESPAAVATHKQQAALLAQQPMLLSVIMVVFACLIIAFVLLVFIVPISVKRLKKRLKNMERQHEQLSQKASTGGSSIVGSCMSHGGSMTVNSMTTSGSSRDGCHGLPSSLSQFTLANSDRSCAIMPTLDHRLANGDAHRAHFRRLQLNRQSSLDSAITNQAENSYNSSQFTTGNQMSTAAQSYFLAAQHHQRAMLAMNQAAGHLHHPQQGANQITCLTNQQQPFNNNNNSSNANNVLNRINNGSIVNPVYLHQLNAANGLDSSAIKASQSNIYCPIDDEFYSTINTDSSVDDEIAAHNYNLYTLQRGQAHMDAPRTGDDAPQMMPAFHGQVGSLIGQTSGPRGSVATGSAQPASLAREAVSPALSTGSQSSTRSLARFLSLPARHWSHQPNPEAADGQDACKWKGSPLEDLQFCLDPAGVDGQPGELAKTIARADRIGQEQQVRHKRTRAQADNSDAVADGWELERHKLRFLNILDDGQFGLVWRCKLRVRSASSADQEKGPDELTVAVKTLKSFAAKDAKERDELLAEIEIMKLVCNHPNVVRILHCCTRDIGPTRPILLVMEHVELGKLQSFLQRSRANHQYATGASLFNNAGSRSVLPGDMAPPGPDYRASSVASSTSDRGGVYVAGQGGAPPAEVDLKHHGRPVDCPGQLTSRDLIKFIYHVAKGMEHISLNCIVHRDLASRNILVSSQRVCKIGDFGMARHMENMGDVYERHSRNTKVPVRWMAPEVLLENTFTTMSDVFSFGILMWEIVTLGSTPYRHLKTDQIIQAVARNGQRPERPEYCHELLYSIMSRCWSHEPSKRPTFQELVAQLDGLLMSTEEYIQLDQYPDHNYYNMPQTAALFELL